MKESLAVHSDWFVVQLMEVVVGGELNAERSDVNGLKDAERFVCVVRRDADDSIRVDSVWHAVHDVSESVHRSDSRPLPFLLVLLDHADLSCGATDQRLIVVGADVGGAMADAGDGLEEDGSETEACEVRDQSGGPHEEVGREARERKWKGVEVGCVVDVELSLLHLLDADFMLCQFSKQHDRGRCQRFDSSVRHDEVALKLVRVLRVRRGVRMIIADCRIGRCDMTRSMVGRESGRRSNDDEWLRCDQWIHCCQ